MPNFLDTFDKSGGAVSFDTLDAFTQGYIEALFFTNCSAWSKAQIAADPEGWAEAEREGQSDGALPSDAAFADLAPGTLARIIRDCAAFQADASIPLHAAYSGGEYEADQAGRDFWFTRNGHGCGFWDRAPLEADGIGEALSGLARAAGEVDAYIGDDGKIYAC